MNQLQSDIPKKIILLGSAYPLRGGIATYNERLALAYQQRGDEVEIFSFSLQYPGFLFPGKTQYSNDPPPVNLKIRSKVNSINPFNWFATGRLIRKLKPDILIVRYWMPFMAPCLGTICQIVKRNRHTTIIAITDNIIPHEKMPGGRMLSRFFVRSCHGFLSMSRAVLHDLESLDLLKPKRYNPHPLYDNFGDPVAKEQAKNALNLPDDDNYVLFFGFIREYKGLDLLIRALADEKLKEFPLKLLVAGEFYVDPEPYYALIKELHLENRIILHTEFISNAMIVNYFCACDLVAQPYREATQSGVTQIAYHFNKPIVTTNVGGLSETVPDGRVGYVVNPHPTEISNAIYRFYDEKKENEFVLNILEEKKRFSWERLLDTIGELYCSIKNKFSIQ